MALQAPNRTASFHHAPGGFLAPARMPERPSHEPRRGAPQLRRAYRLGAHHGTVFVENILGQGGRATVFGVYSKQAGRTLALRVVSLAEESRGSLIRSIWLQQSCTSSSVIAVMPPIFNPTHAWTLMEYGGGLSVEDLLDKSLAGGRLLGVPAALRLFFCMADALRACHARGVVHGDIKPDNFVVVDDAPLGHESCKLADFEMATLVGQTPLGMGTAPYVAPELLAGQPSAPAADLWALGASLFQMLVGVTPHDDDDEREILRQVREDDPDLSMNDLHLVLRDRGVPRVAREALVKIVASLMHRDPDKRMSAQDILETRKIFFA